MIDYFYARYDNKVIKTKGWSIHVFVILFPIVSFLLVTNNVSNCKASKDIQEIEHPWFTSVHNINIKIASQQYVVVVKAVWELAHFITKWG